MLAAVRGYRCVVVMPEGYGHVKARLMEGFGAEVVEEGADLVFDTVGGELPGAERVVTIAVEGPTIVNYVTDIGKSLAHHGFRMARGTH